MDQHRFDAFHKPTYPERNGYYCFDCDWYSPDDGDKPGTTAMESLWEHIIYTHHGTPSISTSRYHGDPINCQCEFLNIVKI